MLKKVHEVVINHPNHIKMKLFQYFDVILMKKSMLVVIPTQAMEFIYLNLIIVIHYGVQKHFIIVFIIQDENDKQSYTKTIFLFFSFHFISFHLFIFILCLCFVFNCDLMFYFYELFLFKHTFI